MIEEHLEEVVVVADEAKQTLQLRRWKSHQYNSSNRSYDPNYAILARGLCNKPTTPTAYCWLLCAVPLLLVLPHASPDNDVLTGVVREVFFC